ncbi:MAG: hypothetical protein PHS92_05640 [Candidatus Gracilibacteria bacterium]|nr:hypothetical protein [Candidatus Gracilibacteria bacterium]
MSNKKPIQDDDIFDGEEDLPIEGEGFFEESLEELLEEEKENFSGHRLDTFSEVRKHDGSYNIDEEYFEQD